MYAFINMVDTFSSKQMNGPQRTAVSRKDLWQKRKQKNFLIIYCKLVRFEINSIKPVGIFARAQVKNLVLGILAGGIAKSFLVLL